MRVTDLYQRLEGEDYSVTELPDGTAALLDLHRESLVTFNGTGAFMLSCVGEGISELDIVRRVVERYDVDETAARADVTGFLAQLADAVGPSADD